MVVCVRLSRTPQALSWGRGVETDGAVRVCHDQKYRQNILAGIVCMWGPSFGSKELLMLLSAEEAEDIDMNSSSRERFGAVARMQAEVTRVHSKQARTRNASHLCGRLDLLIISDMPSSLQKVMLFHGRARSAQPG
jgi:hypothetical protein